MKYYYVTSLEGWLETAQKKKIEAEKDGFIRLVPKKEYAATVAVHILGLKDYGLISVDSKGIKGELLPCAKSEFDDLLLMVKVWQSEIEERYLTRLNMYKIGKTPESIEQPH